MLLSKDDSVGCFGELRVRYRNGVRMLRMTRVVRTRYEKMCITNTYGGIAPHSPDQYNCQSTPQEGVVEQVEKSRKARKS